MNRSPSCGVETTSKDNREVEGMSLFMQILREKLEREGIKLKFVGVKTSEVRKSLEKVRKLLVA